jgi:hypothetical protein
VKIFVALLIASFVAVDFYLWNSLQKLWVKREEAMLQSVISSRHRMHNSKAGGGQAVPEVEERR